MSATQSAAAQDAAQADGDGPDGPEGSDEPPHESQRASTPTVRGAFLPSTDSASQHATDGSGNGANALLAEKHGDDHGRVLHDPLQFIDQRDRRRSIPLPPKEAGAFPKEPGHTRGTLGQLIVTATNSPSTAESARTNSSIDSHSPSGSESDNDSFHASPPSTVPHSRAGSRAPSFSQDRAPLSFRSRLPSFSSQKSQKSQDPKEPMLVSKSTSSTLLQTPVSVKSSTPTPTPSNVKPSPAVNAKPPSRTPSVHSDGGHKFTLKDLLGAAPKLHRRSSQKSNASSKESDGDRRSTAGDSSVSLTKKYGVCDRLAIGKGATSVVRLAHKWDRSEEKLYAVKEFRKRRKNETEREYIKKLTAEFCIASTFHHVNIIETVDLVQDENQHWCEVMEFCPGGDLYAAIKRNTMTPGEIECCFKQLLTGIAYLHSQGVAHRDIKPENILFNTRGQLKIGDFGASTVYRLPWETTVHMSTGLCGSEPYIAPELFEQKVYDARLVDVWACGIVFYCMQFQELPWRIAKASKENESYLEYVRACQQQNNSHTHAPSTQTSFPQTINLLSPRQCRAVIRKMLEPDPKLRWTTEEIMKHPWVKSIEVCHDVDKPGHIHAYARSTGEGAGHAH